MRGAQECYDRCCSFATVQVSPGQQDVQQEQTAHLLM
jgi:hypothetical protein